MIRVVNKYKEKYDIYIGRGSKWGNPYSHLDGTKALYKVATREEAVAKYAEWIQTQPALLKALPELKDKRFGCYCAPKLCHGDILKGLVEKL